MANKIIIKGKEIVRSHGYSRAGMVHIPFFISQKSYAKLNTLVAKSLEHNKRVSKQQILAAIIDNHIDEVIID